MPDRKDEMSIT